MKTSTLMKLLFIALSLVLVISLVACTGEPTVDPEGSDSSVEESDPNDETPSDESQDPTPNESEDSSDDSDETPDTPACEHVEEEIPAIAATCTTDGATAGKKCSVCGEVLTAPTTIPATGHTEEEIPAVNATCSTDGKTAGKKCSVCDTVLETPTTVPAGHTEEEIPAVAPTCTEDGTTAGKKCSECGEVLETPTTDPATGHNKVDKAYTAATTQEEGWLAHKYCEACGTAWDAEDNEIDVPALPVIVPTTNKYWGVAEMSGFTVSGTTGSLFNAPEVSADRTFVRFSRGGTSEDGFINFMASNTGVTGQYLVIKYRTDSSTSGECWANTTADGHSEGKANFTMTFNTDGEWHIEVIDLAAKISSYVKANEDGEYVIQWARIDILNNKLDEGYFDIGFIALTDDLSKVASVMLDGDKECCDHNFTTIKVWDTTEKIYTSICYLCGKALNQAVLHSAKPVAVGGSKITATQEDGFMRYAVNASGDNYVHIYSGGTAVTGKYMIIKYRAYDPDETKTSFATRTYYAGSAKSANGGAVGNGDAGVSTSGAFIVDGEWHYQIVWITVANTQFGANEDGTYTWKYLRIGFNPATLDGSAYIDIESIAFCDTLYAANVYAYGDDAVCTHNSATYTWSSTDELYTVGCADCGYTKTDDMIYKSEANTAKLTTNADWLTATTVTEDGETFVRYTPKTSSSDPYFYPFIDNTANVTGQYMVIKYRLTNNGADAGLGSMFTSSGAQNQSVAQGQNGDSKNTVVSGSPLIADGEWHYLVITPDLENNLTFVANADGTYTWRYFRFTPGFNAYDGTCYLDIAEIAFADNLEAVNCYTAENDAQ